MTRTKRPLHGLRITGAAFLALLGVLLQSAVLYFLWNWLTPRLFGWPAINPWEAAGLFVLSKILFGRIRFRYPPVMEKSVARLKLDRKMAAMSEEEKERFKKEMAGKFRGFSGLD